MPASLAQNLTEKLIACPSVTPRDKGAMDILINFLKPLGFQCDIYEFGHGIHKTKNLYAKWGSGEPNLAFAGHVDVVPSGDEKKWSSPPFTPTIKDGFLYGRGAVDMKGGIAAWCAALAKFLPEFSSNITSTNQTGGALSLLITGDEEGHAKFGTEKLLTAISERGEKLSACIIGEPTCPDTLGQMIKIGRRGSLSGHITVDGIMGHAGYPHLADNPAHRLIDILTTLKNWQIDKGSKNFEPSHLVITTIDIGNSALNIIPEKATAHFNIRFNDQQTGQDLIEKITNLLTAFDKTKYHIAWQLTAESFLTPEGDISQTLTTAIEKITGIKPQLATLGGISDSRFIKNYCPVVDFGHVNKTIHQIDEKVALQDLDDLSKIYYEFMVHYFNCQTS
ncbi:MAG: succinyl-diaminopimelate desuccinylase [Alphaproteobacteria bacterium]